MEKRPIFISHSGSTDQWTLDLVKTLKANGYEVWYDAMDLHPGMDVEQTIFANLYNSSDVLLIVTTLTQRSEWVQREILGAVAVGRRIIPILRDNTHLEGLLSNRQVIDVTGLDGFTSAHRVIGALHVMSFDPVPQRDTNSVRVFISHSSSDNQFTHRFVQDLQARGAVVWVDFDQIHHGDFWKRINDGLSQSNWLILIISPEALGSKVVELEVNAAFGLYTSNQMKGIIPLVAQPFEQNTMPAVWSTLQRYDGSGNKYSTALAGVLTALGLHA